ncbi:hypothetical protein N9L68_08265 [bacterium]|nr:hypothetical protein [bacterium]
MIKALNRAVRTAIGGRLLPAEHIVTADDLQDRKAEEVNEALRVAVEIACMREVARGPCNVWTNAMWEQMPAGELDKIKQGRRRGDAGVGAGFVATRADAGQEATAAVTTSGAPSVHNTGAASTNEHTRAATYAGGEGDDREQHPTLSDILGPVS